MELGRLYFKAPSRDGPVFFHTHRVFDFCFSIILKLAEWVIAASSADSEQMRTLKMNCVTESQVSRASPGSCHNKVNGRSGKHFPNSPKFGGTEKRPKSQEGPFSGELLWGALPTPDCGCLASSTVRMSVCCFMPPRFLGNCYGCQWKFKPHDLGELNQACLY